MEAPGFRPDSGRDTRVYNVLKDVVNNLYEALLHAVCLRSLGWLRQGPYKKKTFDRRCTNELSPQVCMNTRSQPEDKTCSDVGSSAVLNDPHVRPSS